jgi:hypothetical protein
MLERNLRLVSMIGRHSLENGFEDPLLNNTQDLGFYLYHEAVVVKSCRRGTKSSLN